MLLLGNPSEPVVFGGREADGYLAGRPEPAEVLAWVRALLRRQESAKKRCHCARPSLGKGDEM